MTICTRLLVFALATGCLSGCRRGDAPIEAALPAVDAAEPAPSTPSEPEAGKAADRPLEITWEDLDIKMEPDTLYESWMMTTRVRAVTDRYVRITGYMYGGLAQKDGVREFPLMRELECPFGPGGHAHHAIEVNLQGKLRTSYTSAPRTVEGFLTVSPFTGTNGKTWSLYHLEGTKIQ